MEPVKHIKTLSVLRSMDTAGNIAAALLPVLICITLATACERERSTGEGVADIDGNMYDTVVIGAQVWMAENLRTTRLNDGTQIPLVESDTAWAALRSPGYCWYGNYMAFFSLNRYGALYNWYAVKSGRLCPTGWHVPDIDEWYELTGFLGETQAGGKMKEAGTLNWITPNTGATNESGFTALPGGFRNTYYKDFQRFRSIGYFWSSRVSDAMSVSYSSVLVTRGSLSDNDGLSVRCIKDR